MRILKLNTPTVSIRHFTIKDLTCRCGCGRYKFEDSFLVRLEAFRLSYGDPLVITCGGRCVKHNKEVGGVPTSLHQCETKPASAVDTTGADCQEIYKAACLSGLSNEVEWHKTDGKNFVHLGYDAKQKGKDFKII